MCFPNRNPLQNGANDLLKMVNIVESLFVKKVPDFLWFRSSDLVEIVAAGGTNIY